MKKYSERSIAILSLVGIAVHLVLRFGLGRPVLASVPLLVVLVAGGGPLVWVLALNLIRREFGSDLLAGMSIVASLILGEYLAGAFVVLMLSGGKTIESYAVQRASSVLHALAKRMPNTAHRKRGENVEEVALDRIAIGDVLIVYPHEICPIDGVVVEGHSVMDESYLTGEPFKISKTPGSAAISGAINGDSILVIRAAKLAVDSRYAKIMQVMRETEIKRPHLRRLGDQLGAIYTPIAVAIALIAWAISGEAVRFLAVLVVATPCPLLIAIPVAIIGSISLAAKRGIIIKNPAVLEQIDRCRTIILDKTGTLTYGAPELTAQICASGFSADALLAMAAGLEQYSKHPLAQAIVTAARERKLPLENAAEIAEVPGEGLRGTIGGRAVEITSRKRLLARDPGVQGQLPPATSGLECVILVDGTFAALYQFHDMPRQESASFVHHLGPKHRFGKIMLVSGDREAEVRYLAEHVGIQEVRASQTPEEKVAIVRDETRRATTLFIGDGINDAPALMAASVGIAFGQRSDITTEAAGAVIMDTSLERVDELFHIARRMRSIALQSAVGGMALSVVGMMVAAAGYLPPVAGAITQEAIDLVAVLNALRVALPVRHLSDF